MADKRHILIIEDEVLAAKALESKFQRCGFETMAANTGEDAVALLCKHTFDVILSDLVLPKMGGHEVISWMREKNIATPVIILSNLCSTEDIAKSRELGAKEHFIKSMTPMRDVVAFVEQLLAK